MQIFKISSKQYRRSSPSPILDALEGAIRYTFEGVQWEIGDKTRLMNIGVLKDYGVLEMTGKNVKFEDDSIFIKIFFEIWSGEYSGHGVGQPKNIPVYRGFIEGSRKTKWQHEENIGTHKDTYGDFSKLVDLMSPERKDMCEIGVLEGVTGKAIDVARVIKSIIDKWGDDSDSQETISPDPVPVGSEKLVSV